jgi:hypothetical protein
MNRHNSPTIIGVSIIGSKKILSNFLPNSSSSFKARANNNPKMNSRNTAPNTNIPVVTSEDKNIPSVKACLKFSRPTNFTVLNGLASDKLVKLIHNEYIKG